MDRLVVDTQTLQIYSEEFFAFLFGRAVELFGAGRAANNGRVQRTRPIGAKKNQNTTVMAAKVVDFLDYGVNRYLVLVVTLDCLPGGC
jgi:hypothetical protein